MTISSGVSTIFVSHPAWFAEFGSLPAKRTVRNVSIVTCELWIDYRMEHVEQKTEK
jgi:hypothetical protein